jgi:hypothetical protein
MAAVRVQSSQSLNPEGCANPTFCGTPISYTCAMVYVFDNTQIMGECCGCPVGAQTFMALSVKKTCGLIGQSLSLGHLILD